MKNLYNKIKRVFSGRSGSAYLKCELINGSLVVDGSFQKKWNSAPIYHNSMSRCSNFIVSPRDTRGAPYTLATMRIYL